MGKSHQLERKLTETADNKFSRRDGSISTSKQCVKCGNQPVNSNFDFALFRQGISIYDGNEGGESLTMAID